MQQVSWATISFTCVSSKFEGKTITKFTLWILPSYLLHTFWHRLCKYPCPRFLKYVRRTQNVDEKGTSNPNVRYFKRQQWQVLAYTNFRANRSHILMTQEAKTSPFLFPSSLDPPLDKLPESKRQPWLPSKLASQTENIAIDCRRDPDSKHHNNPSDNKMLDTIGTVTNGQQKKLKFFWIYFRNKIYIQIYKRLRVHLIQMKEKLHVMKLSENYFLITVFNKRKFKAKWEIKRSCETEQPTILRPAIQPGFSPYSHPAFAPVEYSASHTVNYWASSFWSSKLCWKFGCKCAL